MMIIIMDGWLPHGTGRIPKSDQNTVINGLDLDANGFHYNAKKALDRKKETE